MSENRKLILTNRLVRRHLGTLTLRPIIIGPRTTHVYGYMLTAVEFVVPIPTVVEPVAVPGYRDAGFAVRTTVLRRRIASCSN